MEQTTLDSLAEQVRILDRRLRRGQGIIVALAALAALLLVALWSRRVPDPGLLRARRLLIEDEQGRPRIILGAPLPNLVEDGRELPPRIGMVIQDSAGWERMGLCLDHRGSIGIGLDAPPGKGDDRNRERINLWADEEGGATIRFLDRRTAVPGRLYLDEENRVWLEFLDFPEGEVIRRRIGFTGEETIRQPR